MSSRGGLWVSLDPPGLAAFQTTGRVPFPTILLLGSLGSYCSRRCLVENYATQRCIGVPQVLWRKYEAVKNSSHSEKQTSSTKPVAGTSIEHTNWILYTGGESILSACAYVHSRLCGFSGLLLCMYVCVFFRLYFEAATLQRVEQVFHCTCSSVVGGARCIPSRRTNQEC